MRSRRRGSILIVVLFVSVVIGLLAVSLTYRAALVLRTSRHRAIQAQLRAQADSVAAIAMSRLAQNTNAFDHTAEPWCAHAPLAEEDWLAAWTGDGQGENAAFVATYRVRDEEGKLHVHLASSESLRRLGMSDEQIDCLFDYMDADDYTRAGGAETSYYLGLDVPRRCKDAPLEVLDELLTIKGFDASTYWGLGIRDPDEPAAWVDRLTCVAEGRVNINTAGPAVLRAMGVSEAGAGQIDAFRRFDAFSSGDLAEHAFSSQEDIEQLQGLSDGDIQMLAGRVVFRSMHFRILIVVKHVPTSLRYAVDVLVRCDGDTVDVLQWRRVS